RRGCPNGGRSEAWDAASSLLQRHCRSFTTMDTKDTKEHVFLRPNPASHAVIDCAMRVHTGLGAGMLESTVSACLLYELANRGLHVEHQVRLPVVYREVQLPTAYRIDFIVEKCVIVEIKCVEKLLPVHTAQVLSYLRLS